MFVIEHMEPRLYKWCILEYSHISDIVGKSSLMFTNLRDSEIKKLKALGRTEKRSVNDLNFANACILDPFAEKQLSTDDKFDYYVFGGILGDMPMRKRTEEIHGSERRNLGHEQMSTDTAVAVAKHILDGGKMSELEFVDEAEVDVEDGESFILPYRYISRDGRAVLAPGLSEHMKKGF